MESIEQFEERNLAHFARLLPTNEHWRMFGDFRGSVAYLDIETNGLAGSGTYITTIAVYDGKTISYYVKDRDLHRFREDIARYDLLVTYNGRCFDIPVIESSFGIRMPEAHIDLRFLLKSLGYTGGLKGCERKLGLDRGELNGVDGYFAVTLWDDYKRNHNMRALETLLAYNILDAVNLEALMVTAYNMKVRETPFGESHSLPLPIAAKNPFTPHRATIKRLMSLRECCY